MKLAVDSDTLRYFRHANQKGYDPADEPEHLAQQRVAAFRLYVYGPVPIIVPTVLIQAERHPEPAIKHELVVWIGFHLDEVEAEHIDATKRDERVAELQLLHAGPGNLEDCRIVAECEQRRIEVLASNDKGLRRLSTKELFIGRPVACWERLQIPRALHRDAHQTRGIRSRRRSGGAGLKAGRKQISRGEGHVIQVT